MQPPCPHCGYRMHSSGSICTNAACQFPAAPPAEIPPPPGELLLRFPGPKPVTPHDDVAQEYAIVRQPTACSGLIVFARWGDSQRNDSDGWEANPSSMRPVIAALLEMIDSRRADFREQALGVARRIRDNPVEVPNQTPTGRWCACGMAIVDAIQALPR